MKAGCVLLEPYYRFSLTVPAEHVGRVMTDLAAMGADCGAPETQGACARLSGRGPVAALMDYPAALRALTHGEGEISLLPDGYDPCRDPAPAVASAAYDPGADTDNPAGSVFCSHGAGYFVPWDEADALMHLPVEQP